MSHPSSELHGLPAMLYTALWPMKVDGRLYKHREVTVSVFVHMRDYPPAALLDVRDGDFRVTPVTGPAALAEARASADIRVEGEFATAVRAMEGVGRALRILLGRKLKIKGKRHALKLAKIFLARGFAFPDESHDAL